MYRLDALAGADLFLVVAEWPLPRSEMLRILARTRAAENQLFLALCNRTGVASDGLPFGGGSVIVAPDGAVIVDAGAAEGIAMATIDQRRIGTIRTEFPVLSLRAQGLDW
jgi:predicted amidohydrolase